MSAGKKVRKEFVHFLTIERFSAIVDMIHSSASEERTLHISRYIARAFGVAPSSGPFRSSSKFLEHLDIGM